MPSPALDIGLNTAESPSQAIALLDVLNILHPSRFINNKSQLFPFFIAEYAISQNLGVQFVGRVVYQKR